MKKLLIIALLSLFSVGCGERYTFERKKANDGLFTPEILYRYDHWTGKVAYHHSSSGKWIDIAR